MKLVIIFAFEICAIGMAILWVRSDSGWEPKITLLVLLGSFVGTLAYFYKKYIPVVLKILRPSHSAWYTTQSERIACICYRIDSGDLKFLLIRDSDNRKWGIPKCMINTDISFSQNIQTLLEEEAGAENFEIIQRSHQYYHHLDSETKNIFRVSTSLVKIRELGVPLEAKIGIERNPTFFTIDEVEENLKGGRKLEFYRDLFRLFKIAQDDIITYERYHE